MLADKLSFRTSEDLVAVIYCVQQRKLAEC